MLFATNPIPRSVICNQTVGNFHKGRVYFVESFTYKPQEKKFFVKIQGQPGLQSPNIFEEDKKARVNILFQEIRRSGCNRKIYMSVRLKEPKDIILHLSGTKQTCKSYKIPKNILEKLAIGGLFVIGKDSNFCDLTIQPDDEFSRIQGFFTKFSDGSIAFYDTSANGSVVEV